MRRRNYSDEFKRNAVHQIRVRGYPIRQVSERLGVSPHTLNKWLKQFEEPEAKSSGAHEAENQRLKRELTRVTE